MCFRNYKLHLLSQTNLIVVAMDPKIVKKTQDSLGKIIKKPPLTDKLLNKPPFRFLHDIITEVIRTTDFMKGLFTPEEMDSKNVTTKESKILFLQKLIDCIATVSGENLSVRPNKVIAGHEPENTNALLQAVASCIRKKMSSADAVEQVLSGKPGRKSSKHQSTDKLAVESKQSENQKDEKRKSKHDKEKSKQDREKSKHDLDGERGKEKKSDRGRHSSSKDKDDPSKDKHESDAEKSTERKSDHRKRSASKLKDEKEKDVQDSEIEKTKEKKSDHRKHSSSKHKDDPDRASRKKTESDEEDAERAKNMEKSEKELEKERRRKERKQKEKEAEEKLGEPEMNLDQTSTTRSSRGPRPASAKGQRRKPSSHQAKKNVNGDVSDDEIGKDQKQTEVVRPGAPKIKKRASIVENEIDSGAPQRTAPIIVDYQTDETHSDEDDTQFIVKEEAAALDRGQDVPSDAGITSESDEEHGGLVKKILKTKKELEESAAGSHRLSQHTEIERSTISAQQKKEKEMVAREVEELRNSVQKLCQSVAPLAKIIDYIQEDMDSMQNELSYWKNENKQHAKQLKEEEITTQRSIEPLHHDLQEMERSIIDYRNQMAATKANILRNDEKIKKMVIAVATRA